jgi:hypothetical protein
LQEGETLTVILLPFLFKRRRKMTVHSKINYDDQDDGRILKAARKQHHIMFPAPIAFLNDELKAKIGMRTKKDDIEDDTKCCSLKVPIDSKTYIVKIHKYDTGTQEEFLKWRMTLMEQIKTNGYEGKYDMVMNLAQEMLRGHRLDAFVNERRAQMAKNKPRAAKNQNESNDQQIHDYAIFELAIRAFEIQSGWRDAFERQRKYTRRYLLMGKLNPDKFSQRLEELNKYLGYIPIEKSNPKRMAYGQSLPDDEISSIMGRAIPPEWTVNLLSIIFKMARKSPGRSSEGKRKHNE